MNGTFRVLRRRLSTERIRVRFAPSPTGNLHIGGVRTALYNWLYARNKGGKFILRIEDTDDNRSTIEFENSLKANLKWMGLNWDEGPDVGGDYGPYRQSERLHTYSDTANLLIKKGYAYKCFCTEAELEQQRKQNSSLTKSFKYNGKWRDADARVVKSMLDANQPYSIRFKRDSVITPTSSKLSMHDIVRGNVEWDIKAIVDDFIIIRSNGLPVYNFCVAVDDALMEISHVIRGEEHLTNTVKQLMILKSLEYKPPQYCHVSLILGKDRLKLSKRHGSVSLDQFVTLGYQRDVLINFLALLGWNDGSTNEIFTSDQLISSFSLNRLVKSAAVFDIHKLNWLSSHYLRSMTKEDRIVLLIDWMTRSGLKFRQGMNVKLRDVACSVLFDVALESCHTILEIVDIAKKYMIVRDLNVNASLGIDLAIQSTLIEFMKQERVWEDDVVYDEWWKRLVEKCCLVSGNQDCTKVFVALRLFVTMESKGAEIRKIIRLRLAGRACIEQSLQ